MSEKTYYVVNPDDVIAVLEHRMDYAKVNRKDGDKWVSVGYLSWTKPGKALTIMIGNQPLQPNPTHV